MTDWLTDWLTGWLADWLTDWLAACLPAWLTDQHANRPNDLENRKLNRKVQFMSMSLSYVVDRQELHKYMSHDLRTQNLQIIQFTWRKVASTIFLGKQLLLVKKKLSPRCFQFFNFQSRELTFWFSSLGVLTSTLTNSVGILCTIILRYKDWHFNLEPYRY